MKTKTVKYNSSLGRIVYSYKIQIKQKNKWKDLYSQGLVKVFTNPYHADNYGRLLNQNHKCYAS